jgi:hypothetical protein
MPWEIDDDGPLPVLANGEYGLTLTPEDEEELRAYGTLGELERGLYELAGRQRKPRVGRDALRDAIAADGRGAQDQLNEIWGLLHPPAGGVRADDND